MRDWNSGSIGDRLKLVVFSLIPVALLLIVFEIVAGAIIHRAPITTPDPATGGSIYSMRIGRFPWSPQSVTHLNSLGFPDDEFDSIEKGGCIHVVFSGDSYTFGDAVDRDKNWVSLAREMTRERFPERCIRFFNIAERMTTIEQQSQRILETLDLLRPDIVILGQFQNDLTDLTIPGSIAYRPPAPGQQSNFWGDVLRTSVPGFNSSGIRFLTYRLFAELIHRDVTYEAPLSKWSILADTTAGGDEARRLMGIYRDIYSDLKTDLNSKGIEFGVVVLPSKLDVLARRYPEGEYFLNLAFEHDVPFLDMTPVLFERREQYAFQMYDGHLSEFGNALVAVELMTWLFDSDPPPFRAVN